MQTSHTIHPCLPRMVAIARMLSPPRCMYGICVDGGASHVETRSPTSVWSAPGPGSVRACFLSRTHCTSHGCTFPMSGYWVVCEEHFRPCSKHWLPLSMLVQKIDSRGPPFTKLCWCSRGEIAPSDTRRTTTGKTPLLPRCACRQSANTPVSARSSKRQIAGAGCVSLTATARLLPAPF